MKCKDCKYCSQRGSYRYFFCDKDNELIEADDYYKGREMKCTITKQEDREFAEDYIIYNIVRKR